jgi:CYTH domain-containing protein
MERERKFLVAKLPSGLNKHPRKRIRQGYLAIPSRSAAGAVPVEVRVRDESGQKVLTVKGGRGANRSETEMPISPAEFRSLWPLTKSARIEKVRYRIPMGKRMIELDVYGGKLRGLKTAEVEFTSDAQLRKFQPPQWFGREVTGQQNFSNSQLAAHGRSGR